MPKPSAENDPAGPRYPERHPHTIESGSPEWMEWVYQVDGEMGYKVCGRYNRHDEPCRNRPNPSPMPTTWGDGRRPCTRIHSGKPSGGIAANGFIHGRRSRYRLTGKLAGAVERASDMEYMSSRDDLNVVDELIQQALSVLDSDHEAPEPLDPNAFDEAEVKARKQQIADFHLGRSQAYVKVQELWDTRNRLARTEIQRVRAAADTISGQQVRAFGQIVLDQTRTTFTELAAEYSVPQAVVVQYLQRLQQNVFNAVHAAKNPDAIAAQYEDEEGG